MERTSLSTIKLFLAHSSAIDRGLPGNRGSLFCTGAFSQKGRLEELLRGGQLTDIMIVAGEGVLKKRNNSWLHN